MRSSFKLASPHFFLTPVSLTMNSLQQHVLPAYPPTIRVRHFRHGQSAELLRQLLDMNPVIVGLSIRLSSDGEVDCLALATSQEVLLARLDTGGTEIRSFTFDGLRYTLIAFDMAQLVLHIYRKLKQHLQGVDLSTLMARSTETLSDLPHLYNIYYLALARSILINSGTETMSAAYRASAFVLGYLRCKAFNRRDTETLTQ